MYRIKTVVCYVLMGATLLFDVFALSSCRKKEEAPAGYRVESVLAPRSPAPSPDAQGSQPGPRELKRKLILNYSISLEVKDFTVALQTLTRLAESNGGYVFNSSRLRGENGSNQGRIGIRVPAGKSGGVLKGIRGLGRVESESSDAQDITEEYVDLDARLKNAKSSEARLLALYQRAEKLPDVLSVEKELTRVRGDIESFEAKKKNWDILTEMVTMEVSLNEPSGAFPAFHRFWSPIRSAFGEAAGMFAESLHALIVFLGAVLPWLTVFCPLAYLLLRRLRKKRQKKTHPAPTGASGTE